MVIVAIMVGFFLRNPGCQLIIQTTFVWKLFLKLVLGNQYWKDILLGGGEEEGGGGWGHVGWMQTGVINGRGSQFCAGASDDVNLLFLSQSQTRSGFKQECECFVVSGLALHPVIFVRWKGYKIVFLMENAISHCWNA